MARRQKETERERERERREGGILGITPGCGRGGEEVCGCKKQCTAHPHTYDGYRSVRELQRLRMSSVCLSCQDVRSLWVEQGVGILEKPASPSMD
jgi:hypothetical protein